MSTSSLSSRLLGLGIVGACALSVAACGGPSEKKADSTSGVVTTAPGAGANGTIPAPEGDDQTVVSSTTATPDTTAPIAPLTTAAPTRTVKLEQFQTPTKNIACAATGEDVRCDIEEKSWSPPPRPASCDRDFDWGNGFSILPSGTTTGNCATGNCATGNCATGNCATDTVLNKENPVLAYGEASTIGAITCVSRLDGLTCTHARTKQGFFLSRDSYKQF